MIPVFPPKIHNFNDFNRPCWARIDHFLLPSRSLCCVQQLQILIVWFCLIGPRVRALSARFFFAFPAVILGSGVKVSIYGTSSVCLAQLGVIRAPATTCGNHLISIIFRTACVRACRSGSWFRVVSRDSVSSCPTLWWGEKGLKVFCCLNLSVWYQPQNVNQACACVRARVCLKG